MKKNLALLAGVMVLAGCLQDTPSGPTAEFVDLEPKHTEGGFDKVFAAGDTVAIIAYNTASGESVPANVISSAEAAAGIWNSAIFGLAGKEDSLPHLNETVVEGTSGSGTTIELVSGPPATIRRV